MTETTLLLTEHRWGRHVFRQAFTKLADKAREAGLNIVMVPHPRVLGRDYRRWTEYPVFVIDALSTLPTFLPEPEWARHNKPLTITRHPSK